MAKILFVLILISVCLTGCQNASPEKILAYQNYPLDLSAAYTDGENEYVVRINMEAPDTGSLVYDNPDSLAGLTVTVKGEEILLSGYGFDMLIPKTETASDTEIICTMLSLSADSILSTELRPGQTPLSTAVFQTDHGRVELTLDSGGRPLRLFAADRGILLKNMVFQPTAAEETGE